MKPSVSSLYQAVELKQEIPPLLIGERCNTNGSKKFREMLLAEDFDGCLKVALDQEAGGAQVLDICTAYAGRDEKADLTRLFNMLIPAVKLPLMVDSTQADCVEQILKLYPGRCIINSIHLEDGGANLHKICTLAKRHGAAVVALTIHKAGMAMTTAEKVQTAKDIYRLAVEEHGLRAGDLLFDPLTFTIGSGDESLKDAAIQTLDAIREIKKQLPGVHTLLGVSNISFGLRPAARKILNSVFLHEAVEAGLDAAIVDPAKILPLTSITQEDRDVCLDLIYNRQKDPEKSPLMTFIDYFEEQGDPTQQKDEIPEVASEKILHQQVLKGSKDGLEDILSILLERYRPLDIINTILVPAMRHVGELFGKGEILLPFVLQSAEVMKKSVAFLEPFMDKADQSDKLKILLATVQGDVHDIGKNLVDIILTNNGYQVYNLGIKVPAETIIEKAKEYNVAIVGLSGLLVKSAMVMQESMAQYQEAQLNTPILLGGAALTQKFVAESCVPEYGQPVVYCRDAFAGLKAVREFEQGKLTATVFEAKTQIESRKPGLKNIEIDHTNTVPTPPFLGKRYVTDIDPANIYPYVNEQALFRGRWGYRRGNMTVQAYDKLMQETVIGIYEGLKERGIAENLLQPKVTYGYFKCYSREDSVFVQDENKTYEFAFPRQEFPPHLCISDFFKPEKDGGDIAGFFVVTIGEKIGQIARDLFETDAYHDYLMLHGFGVEVTDALAEYWHEVMRQELGIAEKRPDNLAGFVTQQYQGSRYGFGYPACPDLGAHEHVFKLLKPERIGVTLTENMEMVPEQTTSAIIAHHPQAKYFAV
jgi:5-methyltetrahydrofolate--homocysteine methyltransferase